MPKKMLAYLVSLAAILFVSQFWFRAGAGRVGDSEITLQHAVLRRVEEIDARCRLHRISAESARRALEPLEVPLSDGWNGWKWLRGSEDPLPRSDDEVRKLLAD